MKEEIKKPMKLNVMGLFSLETENHKLWEFVLIMLIVMLFLLAVLFILKVYVLPVLGVPGIVKQAGVLIKALKSRSP
jgi:hypothetical protein